jgi:hypothetical protein
MSDCRTLATLNFMFGTLTIEDCQQSLAEIIHLTCQLFKTHLSFEDAMTTGSNCWHVMSVPMTGASKEIACKVVIRYR